MKQKKTNFIPLLILALVGFSCANQTILNSSEPKSTPIPPSEQPKDSFERALRGVESGNFTYIFVLRRKDGAAFGGEDSKFIRANTPPGTNQFVLTDEDKTIIIGSNFPFSPENLKALGERFNIENYSKPQADEPNKNTNQAEELNKNTNSANK
jgi:hypothetical protein